MPEITVKHDVKNAEPPKRDVLPTGIYHANIVKLSPGTKFDPPRMTLTVEFQVTKTDEGSIVNEEPADKYKGRAVFQDYILEPGGNQYHDQREAFRIQQMMAATKCPYKDVGGGQISFNTDHLMGKAVRISVTQRAGKPDPADPPGTPAPLFNNVARIDSAVVVEDKDLV
jgi:hypothetical protein